MSKHHVIPFPGLFIMATPLEDYKRLTYYGEPKRPVVGIIKTGKKNTRGGITRLFHVRNYGILVHRSN